MNPDPNDKESCEGQFKSMKNYTLINSYKVEIKNHLAEARKKVIVTPVIYDEISNFKDAESYPFEKRKNTLMSNLNADPFSNESNPGDDWSKNGEVRKIFLNTAKVCFDHKWYSDILFWQDGDPCDEESSDNT